MTATTLPSPSQPPPTPSQHHHNPSLVFNPHPTPTKIPKPKHNYRIPYQPIPKTSNDTIQVYSSNSLKYLSKLTFITPYPTLYFLKYNPIQRNIIVCYCKFRHHSNRYKLKTPPKRSTMYSRAGVSNGFRSLITARSMGVR